MPINQPGPHMETEANKYLNQWREVSLISVADIRFSSVNKVSQPGEEPVHLCNYTDVYNNDYITADMDFMRATATRSEIERFGLQVGDVIITKDSETPDDIGIPTVVDTTTPDLVCGYHLALLRPNQDEVDPTFLAKQLAHHRIARYFGQQANGTTRYGLSTAAIANSSLHLPRIENQRSASALMRMVDTQITKIEAVIDKLKQVRTGMLHDLLSYGLNEHGQLRDPIAHPEHFKGSPLGCIPVEWDIFSLSECCSEVVDCPHSTPHFQEVGVLVARTMHIRDGQYDIFASSRVSESEYMQRISRIEPKPGDVIFTREAPVGEAFMIPKGMRICLGQRVMLLRPKDRRLIGSYLVSQIYSGQVRKRIDSLTGGTTNPHLNVAEVRNFILPLPSYVEQERIILALATHELALKTEELLLLKFRKIKIGIRDELLTGLVRVPATILEGVEHE